MMIQLGMSPVSTHSRLKAAGARVGLQCFQSTVSTHSRLKAAGHARQCLVSRIVFQHTAA
mgnify:CR=1 FL=1